MPVPDLSTRRVQPERMDDPGLDPGAHRHALRGLARVHRVSGTLGRIWSAVVREGGSRPAAGPLRVLDVACGGGDVAVGLARRARRVGLPVEVHGCDLSPRALAWVRQRAHAEGLGVHLHELDALRDPLPRGFDLVTSTLFLHHLETEDAVEVLRGMAAAGRRLLVEDLRRTPLGWRMAWWGCRLLTSSSVVRVDGPRSVEAAFTLEEARSLAAAAGLAGVRVEAIWPQRFCLHGHAA